MAEQQKRQAPRARFLFLVYATAALAASVLLLGSFSFLSQRAAHQAIPTLPPSPTSAALPTAAPLPTITPGPSPTSGPCSNCAQAEPSVEVFPTAGPVGTYVTLQGSDLAPNDTFVVTYTETDCGHQARMIPAASGDSDDAGALMITFAWPSTQVGSYVVCAVDVTKGYSLRTSQPFVVTSSTQASLRSDSPVVSGHTVHISGAHFIPDFGSVGIFYGPPKSDGCTVEATTATLTSGGTFDAAFDAPIVSRNQVLIVTAVAPEDGCGATRVEVEAQIEVLVVPASAPPPGAFASNADNPLNLPTGVMQILFAFTTLSGLASLLRFFWDSLLSALKLIPRRSRVPV